MSNQSTITYDNIRAGSITTTSLTVSNLDVSSNITFEGDVTFNSAVILSDLVVQGIIVASDALFDDLFIEDRITTENITVAGSIRYPTQVIEVTPPLTMIVLSDQNSGNIIDANNSSDQYRLSFSEDIVVGNRWEVYINSEIQIIIANDTGKDITASGISYYQDGAIGAYAFESEGTLPPGINLPQPGNKARYLITVTEVTGVSIRIVYHVIFIVDI